jgi:hypothetical protein
MIGMVVESPGLVCFQSIVSGSCGAWAKRKPALYGHPVRSTSISNFQFLNPKSITFIRCVIVGTRKIM